MNQTILLEEGKFYHIYNRGINGCNLFYEAINYDYFLQKYKQYMLPVVDMYAYCLLGNHFHLLISVKEQLPLAESKHKTGLHSADNVVSKCFSNFSIVMQKASIKNISVQAHCLNRLLTEK